MSKKLSQEEKRTKIASACGWSFKPDEFGWSFAKLDKSGPWIKYNSDDEKDIPFPDYFKSLKAIEGAEGVLTHKQNMIWISYLDQTVGFDGLKARRATVAQRAEAFGLTLGLWS